MTIRKIVATIIIAAVFFWAPSPSPSVAPARALTAVCGVTAVPVSCLPTPAPTSTALGVGGGLAVGIIATAALLCIYDIWLKFNGYKNWDGTPKVVQVHVHHHH